MADQSAAAKKAAKTLKLKRAGQKAAVTKKRSAAAKMAWETRRAK
jgi:type IV secretory pathway TrbL component